MTPEGAALHARYYRWYTVGVYGGSRDWAMKLGPLTLYAYWWRWPHVGVSWLGETLFDTGLAAIRRAARASCVF